MSRLSDLIGSFLRYSVFVLNQEWYFRRKKSGENNRFVLVNQDTAVDMAFDSP